MDEKKSAIFFVMIVCSFPLLSPTPCSHSHFSPFLLRTIAFFLIRTLFFIAAAKSVYKLKFTYV